MIENKDSKMKTNFQYFGLISAVYACFFTFCLYNNDSGITMPFFVAGTLYYFFLSMRKLGISRQKDGYFYEIAILLLGFATSITDDERIVFFNFIAIFILLVTYMLHQFFKDSDWDIPQYISSFIIVVFGTIGSLPQPFSHFNQMLKSKLSEKNQNIRYISFGLVIGFPIIIIILLLLSSADFVFANSIEFLWKNIIIPEKVIELTMMTLFAFFASYCFIAYLSKNSSKERKYIRKEGEPLIAITFTSLIALIYLFFSGIQVIYLFLGRMQIPGNFTYAQYAREGFFQLVAVCLLNLLLVIICIYYFRDHFVLKRILVTISLCTYIMIASSAFRMILYINEYHLTFLRIFVLWALVVITALISGIIIYICKPSFQLLKYSLMVLTTLYVLFSFSHPDYFIAKYNYGKFGFVEVDRIDTNYLNELSADAAPVILDYTEKLKKETGLNLNEFDQTYFDTYFSRIYKNGQDMSIRTFNLSRYIGKNAAMQFMEN